MTGSSAEGFLSPSDIAELANVSRAAVSNWRRRHDDFPVACAGSDAKPLFSRSEALAWLDQRGYGVREESAGERLWSQINALRAVVEPDSSVPLLALLAAIKKASRTGQIAFAFEAFAAAEGQRQLVELDTAVAQLSALPNFDQVDAKATLDHTVIPAALPVLARAVAQTPDENLAEAIDLVLERLARWQVKSGADHGFIGSRTSALVANLVDGATGVVYDPACGLANVLVKVAGEGSGARLIGRDINAAVVLLAAERGLLHGAQLDLAVADVLTQDPDPELHADVVLAEPPLSLRWDSAGALLDPRFRFGSPPGSSADMAWIQHAIAHLADDGTAYILTGAGPLFRGGAERKIRANLLAEGCVRAIVGLPPRMLPHTAIPPVLWVVNRSGNSEVLFIDASDVMDAEHKVASWLAADATGAQQLPVPQARVDVTTVLAAEADLTPAKWTAPAMVDSAAVSEAFESATTEMAELIARIADTGRPLLALDPWPESHLATVGDLIESGVLERRLGRFDRDREREGLVKVSDVSRGHLPDSRAQNLADLDQLTQPGDVIVSTTTEVRTIVDTSGGHLLAAGVEALRIVQPTTLSPGYLAAVLAGSWNASHQRGTAVSRARLQALDVPLLPLNQQAAIEQAHHDAMSLRADALQLAASTEIAFDSLLNALRYNIALTPSQFGQ